MKKFQLISFSLLILIPALCFSTVTWGAALSTILDVTPDSEDFLSCLQSNYYSNNVTFISQLVFTPANSSFLPIWEARVKNLRFIKSSTSKPSVIVTPVDESQIRTTLLCSKKHGYEMRVRCGGHDLEGLSSTADVPFVMLDLTNMRSVDVDVANRTAWVQGGAVLGEVYYAISQKTDTLYFPAGLCSTVGVGGYLSGGGYGNLIRKYGTGADNVVDVRFMDVNGNILDRKSMGEDLFWAIRGGGASSFGIVLAWKLRLVPVPELVTIFSVNKTLEEGATEILHKFQYVVPNGDKNLSIRVTISSAYITNTTKKTINVMFNGIYQGTIDTLLPLLDERFPELNVTREICEEVRMVQASLVFGGYTSNTSTEILLTRSSNIILNGKNKLDYVRTPIPITGLKRIWRKVFENDGSEVLYMHPFGGKNDEYSETAIPYPHRAGVLYQFHQQVTFNDQISDTTPTSLRRINWLRSFNEYITPYVSKNPREAYSNYNDLDLGVGSETYEEASVWGERYWKRSNFKKLIRIKAIVDPENFFKHPQSIPVFSKSLSDV
uniref:tetrahydrocannabinolic acid synthase-like n=1 Tax=Erigeron canadensis TaxID=72917 RepID=UPI001CB8C8C3|nr:tetrahydrocannabinolic acid synthase-like [Erigeron canadensis]